MNTDSSEQAGKAQLLYNRADDDREKTGYTPEKGALFAIWFDNVKTVTGFKAQGFSGDTEPISPLMEFVEFVVRVHPSTFPPYALCPCAGGKSFKFCHRADPALKHIKTQRLTEAAVKWWTDIFDEAYERGRPD